jgi:hypothetical protein
MYSGFLGNEGPFQSVLRPRPKVRPHEILLVSLKRCCGPSNTRQYPREHVIYATTTHLSSRLTWEKSKARANGDASSSFGLLLLL